MMQAFLNINKTALKPGAIDGKTKALMCVAIGIANGGEYCIASRTSQAVHPNVAKVGGLHRVKRLKTESHVYVLNCLG